MLRIDDLEFIAGLDQGQMVQAVSNLPEVALAAFERGRQAKLPLARPANVLVCGMGGSAMGGDLVRTQLLEHCSVPVLVNRGDKLPRFAGKDTLAIFMTYSGQTGETLACLREAIARGIPSVVVTSGGSAGALAGENAMPVVSIPGGCQPRAALGDLFFALLGVVSQLEGIPAQAVEATVQRLRTLRSRFEPAVPTTENPAKSLALAIHGKLPMLVGATGTTEAVAMRWKTQLNENGKQSVMLAILPEMTHNDIVNLTARPHHDVTLLVFTDDEDSDFVRRQRTEAMGLIAPHVAEVLEVRGEGETLLERQLTALYLGDWVSVYIGFLNGFDPTPVESIAELKRRLAAQAEAIS